MFLHTLSCLCVVHPNWVQICCYIPSKNPFHSLSFCLLFIVGPITYLPNTLTSVLSTRTQQSAVILNVHRTGVVISLCFVVDPTDVIQLSLASCIRAIWRTHVPPPAACWSGCGLCKYTSDLWSRGHFCKHSSFIATAPSHLKTSVFGYVHCKCRSLKWLTLQLLKPIVQV